MCSWRLSRIEVFRLMRYFQSMSSAFGGFTPDSHRSSASGPSWRKSALRTSKKSTNYKNGGSIHRSTKRQPQNPWSLTTDRKTKTSRTETRACQIYTYLVKDVLAIPFGPRLWRFTALRGIGLRLRGELEKSRSCRRNGTTILWINVVLRII